MSQVREGTYALSSVPVVIVSITTGRAVAKLDAVRAVAVRCIPVLGFLPLGRCCVVLFLCGDFESLSTLLFRQSIGQRVDLRTEERHVVVLGQAATALGVCGGRLAEFPPRGFIQR